MTWAVEMSAYVDAHSDHDVSLWRCDFGYPVGTVVWSAWVDSLADLTAGFSTLVEDDGYHALIEAGLEFTGTAPEDMLREVVHGGPTDGAAPPPLGAVTTVTTAVMAAGKYQDALAWGVEVAQLVEELTQLPTSFLVDGYGTFGQVTWLSGAADPTSADAANAAINASDKYLSSVTDASTLFEPGSGHRAMYTRLA